MGVKRTVKGSQISRLYTTRWARRSRNHSISVGGFAALRHILTIERLAGKSRVSKAVIGRFLPFQNGRYWPLADRREGQLWVDSRHRGSSSPLADSWLYVVQSKTEKASNAGWLKLRVTEHLGEVITRCRDDVLSPYLVHRRPERKKKREGKDHWTKIDERFLTRAFKDARDAAGCYRDLKEEEMPGFHEVRALSLHLYKRAGKDDQKIAGRATEGMTRNYQKGHEDVVWSEVDADLDIGEIAG